MKTYQAKNGKTQYKPSEKQLMAAIDNMAGFCLACGAESETVEPDARRYSCACCGAAKVYGGEELLLMGLYH
jgi:Zn finger protein HypA/HybF involved in hydrogenase expression